MNNIEHILKFAMRMEKDASDFYAYYLDKVQSDSTKKLFSELVEMEKQHYHIIKKHYDALGYKEPPITLSWVVDNSFTARDPHVLSDNADLLGEGEKEISDLSIIRMAYLIENDFAEFYKNAIKTVDSTETKKLLQDLSEWEESHRELFHKKYQELLKKHWHDISSIILAE